jgi:hypothetical protein
MNVARVKTGACSRYGSELFRIEESVEQVAGDAGRDHAAEDEIEHGGL